MDADGRWPVTLSCKGGSSPHEMVTWLGTWVKGDEASNDPPCWVCGEQGKSIEPRYPYVPGHLS